MLKKRDGRVRIILISERDVLDWFVSGVKDWKNVRCLSVPVFDDLPDDASVESVYYDPQGRRFNFIVHSLKFEPVVDGAEIPFFHPFGDQEYRSLAVTYQTPPHVWNYNTKAWRPSSDQEKIDLKNAVLEAATLMNNRTNILIPSEDEVLKHVSITYRGEISPLGHRGDPGPPGQPENKCVCNGGTLACDDPRVKDASHNEADAMLEFFKGTP